MSRTGATTKVIPGFGGQGVLFGYRPFDPAPMQKSIKAATRSCPLSVEQIAEAMSGILGRRVTANMIYDWQAPGKTHQPRLDELGALVIATDCPELLSPLAELAGGRVVGVEGAERLEEAELSDFIEDAAARVRELKARRTARKERKA